MKKTQKKRTILLLAVTLLGANLTACTTSALDAKLEDPASTLATEQVSSSSSTEPLRRTEFMLGTAITLSLYDHQSEALLDEAFELIASLEDTLSINKSGTLIDEINDHSGLSPIQADANTFDVVEKGLSYGELTDGSFDITVGPLVNLWHIGFPDAQVPTDAQITSKLPLIDYKNVVLDSKQQTIYLEQPGMQIDLGGIGKGYAADRVATLFREKGVAHALIDLGGNIFALGNKPNGDLWKIGIQNPLSTRGESIGHVSVQDKSIVTSGIYERFIEEDGKKYHHILNPATGYPFENEIAGVTIISDTSIDGDALSTSVFSKGIEAGLEFVNTLEGIDAIFVSKDNHIYLSAGIIESFVLTDEAFKIAN